ncbi:hypothetical protein LDENG_00150100, partial [Lucifuga dentata]
MSTGVKKPPLAPKPKLPAPAKPSPPPIAPKPGLLTQPSVVSHPSPATLKRTKPAVAPKPCIPKPTSSPPSVSPPPPKASAPLAPSQDHQEAADDSLSLLNSKNGILSETNKRESDYIIPACSCGLQDCSPFQCLEHGNATEIRSDLHEDLLQNGISTEGCGLDETRQGDKTENQEEGVVIEKAEGGRMSNHVHPKPRDKPQRQRHLDQGLLSKEAPRIEEHKGKGLQAVKHQESVLLESCRVPEFLEVTEADPQTETNSKPACDVAGNITNPQNLPPQELPFVASSTETSQVETGETSVKASPTRLDPDLQVPAPPTKPLPVPHPRKPKKPALMRQDCVEGSVQDGAAEERKQGLEMWEAEGTLSLGGLSLSSEGEELKQGLRYNSHHQQDSGLVDDEPDAPVPPPRQTSLSPRLHRSTHAPPSLNKNTSHSLDLLSQPEPLSHDPKKGSEWHHQAEEEEEEEDGYGDFERYPITHSLPKQIKLGCHPPLANTRKAFSAEDQPSPRAPPRKPQRHSLPAPPPTSIIPPAPPHASTPMRELPAPPQEKTSWRFTRPCVTFFSRQIPTRSSVPPKGRAPLLGGKQRAQSFSAADLATRAEQQKRSLSFRKLLELRLSVKMLPKLLAKGGQTLDCTSVESSTGEKSLERPSSCVVEADISGDGGDGSVEYENVPLYEEIPEYMNLPFHSARLGWPHDPDAADSDVYEVQDPFQKPQDEYESGWLRCDVHSEEEEEEEDGHSSDEEDNSSTSSKEHLDEADRQ